MMNTKKVKALDFDFDFNKIGTLVKNKKSTINKTIKQKAKQQTTAKSKLSFVKQLPKASAYYSQYEWPMRRMFDGLRKHKGQWAIVPAEINQSTIRTTISAAKNLRLDFEIRAVDNDLYVRYVGEIEE